MGDHIGEPSSRKEGVGFNQRKSGRFGDALAQQETVARAVEDDDAVSRFCDLQEVGATWSINFAQSSSR